MSNPTPQPPYAQQPQGMPQPQSAPQAPQSVQQTMPQAQQQPAYPAPGAPATGYAPGYPAAPARPAAPTALAQTNAFALVAIILAFLQPIAAIVFGHLALGQIKRTGDGGRGLALAGLVIGYITAGLMIFLLVVYTILMIALLAYMAEEGYTF